MKQMQDNYPGYALTLAPDVSLATLNSVHNTDGAERPREQQTTSHTSRPQTKRIGAGTTTVSVPAVPFAEPYPKQQHPVTITADEWEPKHAHWLDEIPKRRYAGTTAYTAIIEMNWLTRESPKSKTLQLLDAPFADSIRSRTTIDEGFVEEPDMIRQALREIEGMAFQLKKKSPNEAVQLKALMDKPFACRDYQLDNETDVAGEIRKAIKECNEPKVDATTLALEMAKTKDNKDQ
ncbi:hypothetical protein MRS44_001716 [Fusarium solani]|uniref:uncharacterized protein n=1 Tax=Fusarium solani TaxID=169388 RepID=UPI0032C46ABA|nr:hypothetical protein MRS44_001716 [Fusarium solani]